MNDFELGFNLTSNIGSYKRLCQFAQVMSCGGYISITDDDIRKGIDFEKAKEKATLKSIQGFLPPKVVEEADNFIEAKCEGYYRQFKQYKDDHERL